MKSFNVAVLMVLYGATFIVANLNPPTDPRLVNSSYRELTVQWDNSTDYNATAGHMYQIDYIFVNAPSYISNPNVTVIKQNEPKITVSELFTGTTLSFRIGIKDDSNTSVKLFSPLVNFTTRSVLDIREVGLPGKVKDISVSTYIATDNSTAQEIHWQAPDNIFQSKNAEVKSIQYRIEMCNYNPITMVKSICKIVGQVVGKDASNQSSRQGNPINQLQPINVPKIRDVAITITPIALNNTEGPSETLILRMDENSVPAAPNGLKNITNYPDNLTITWNAKENGEMTYLIQYNEEGNATKMTKTSRTTKSITLSNLQKTTTYEIRVAISDSNNGTSLFSQDLSVTTKNETTPTSPPVTTPSSATNIFTSFYLFFAVATLSSFV